MTPDQQIFDTFDSEVSRLASLKYDHLMNLRDHVAYEYDDGGQVRVSFHRYGMALEAPEDGPITTVFRIFAGNLDARIGKDPSYSGDLHYLLEYARHIPMKITKRQVTIEQDWFLPWLQDNLAVIVDDVLTSNELCWKSEENYREVLAKSKAVESKTGPRDVAGWIVGAILGGSGFHSIIGLDFLTPFIAIFSGYAGYLFVRDAFPVEGEDRSNTKGPAARD